MLKLGETYEAVDFDATVLDYQPDAQMYSGPRQAVLVKFCLINAPKGYPGVQLSWRNWVLSDGDGGTFISESTTAQNSLQPQFPFAGQMIGPGECAKGWVEFTGASKAKQAKFMLANKAVATWFLA